MFKTLIKESYGCAAVTQERVLGQRIEIIYRQVIFENNYARHVTFASDMFSSVPIKFENVTMKKEWYEDVNSIMTTANVEATYLEFNFKEGIPSPVATFNRLLWRNRFSEILTVCPNLSRPATHYIATTDSGVSVMNIYCEHHPAGYYVYVKPLRTRLSKKRQEGNVICETQKSSK